MAILSRQKPQNRQICNKEVRLDRQHADKGPQRQVPLGVRYGYLRPVFQAAGDPT